MAGSMHGGLQDQRDHRKPLRFMSSGLQDQKDPKISSGSVHRGWYGRSCEATAG